MRVADFGLPAVMECPRCHEILEIDDGGVPCDPEHPYYDKWICDKCLDEIQSEEVSKGDAGNVKMKPCPFCGCSVRLDRSYSYFRDSVIYCDNCDMIFTLDDCRASDDKICDSWNRRC